MKLIILAAGEGKRLRPYTNDKPKCMVELAGKALLHHQLEVIQELGINKNDIALVGGYLKERLDAPDVKCFVNDEYASTNMVSTLFCAEQFMRTDEDLIIAYGDIIYEQRILEDLLATEGEVVLAADKEWKELWSLRMENPLLDAETFKVKDGRIVELGKRPSSYEDVEAQYMGLVKIRADKVRSFIDFYHGLDKQRTYDGKNFLNMYMTSLLQELILSDWDVRPALISNGWLEVDSNSELENYRRMNDDGTLTRYINLNKKCSV